MKPPAAQAQTAPYQQIDMRDWLYWLDEARSAALRAGAEHRQHFTVVTEAYTWHVLDERMRAAGLQHLRDAPLFRAANQLYHDVYVQAGYPHMPGVSHLDGQEATA